MAEIARGTAGDSGKGIGHERTADEMKTGAGGRPDDPGRSDALGNSCSKASDCAMDTRADIGSATNGTETDGCATNRTVIDVVGGEPDEVVDDTDRDNALEMPSGSGKRAKDVDGSDVAVPPVDERFDDDATVTDNDTTATDDDTTDDESETSSTDDSGV